MREHAFLGERLRQIREQRGLSQAELARRLGAGINQIPRYENNQADPSPFQLKRLAELLDVTSDYLLGLVDTPSGYRPTLELTQDERQVVEALRQGDTRSLLHLLDRTLPTTDSPVP